MPASTTVSIWTSIENNSAEWMIQTRKKLEANGVEVYNIGILDLHCDPTLMHWLLMASFYKGSLMMQLDPAKPKAALAWNARARAKSTPMDSRHHLHARYRWTCITASVLTASSAASKRGRASAYGKRQAVTKEKARWASAFLVRHGDRYFMNNDRGELIIAKLSPKRYEEIARTTLIKPTATAGIGRREMKAVNWTHPAYANRTLYTRNEEELIAVSLSN